MSIFSIPRRKRITSNFQELKWIDCWQTDQGQLGEKNTTDLKRGRNKIEGTKADELKTHPHTCRNISFPWRHFYRRPASCFLPLPLSSLFFFTFWKMKWDRRCALTGRNSKCTILSIFYNFYFIDLIVHETFEN